MADMNSPDTDFTIYIGMRCSINFNLNTIETSSVRYLVSLMYQNEDLETRRTRAEEIISTKPALLQEA